METSTTQVTTTGQATVTVERPKRNKKARVAPPGAHVASPKAMAGKKASPAKKAPSGQKKASAARAGSKSAKLLELLQRSDGATLEQLMRASGWQAHYADLQIMPTCVGNPACGAVIAAMESA